MDQDQEPRKGTLGALIQETQENSEERQETDKRIRIILARETLFNRQDDTQQFYFQTQELGSKDMLLKKLGWKIIDLQKQQEDLGYFCFNLLAAQIKLPLNIFTNSIENKEGTRKSLWMEMSVHSSGQSKSIQGWQHNTQVQIYKFCEYRLLPLLRAFIAERITWTQISRPDYSQDKLLELFKIEVIQKVNEMIKKEFKGE